MMENLWQGVVYLFSSGDDRPVIERRSLVRIRCRFPVLVSYRIEGDGKGHQATVVDMGITGMKLEAVGQMKEGTRIRVTLLAPREGFTQDTVACRVVWCRSAGEKLAAGVVYEDTHQNIRNSWVKTVLRGMGFDESYVHQRRRHIRAECRLPAVLQSGGQRLTNSIAVDLGVAGALVAGPSQPEAPDQEVLLELGPYRGMPVLRLRASVVSVRNEGQLHCLGLRFDRNGQRQTRLLGRYVLRLLKERPQRSTRAG